MEAPLEGAGSADDGSSLLPPAARAGMTVRIKRKERVRENWISLIIASAALKSSSTLCLVFCVVLVFHFCLLSTPREAFNSSECSGCSMLRRVLRADLEWNSRRVFIVIIIVPLLTFFLLSFSLFIIV